MGIEEKVFAYTVVSSKCKVSEALNKYSKGYIFENGSPLSHPARCCNWDETKYNQKLEAVNHPCLLDIARSLMLFQEVSASTSNL